MVPVCLLLVNTISTLVTDGVFIVDLVIESVIDIVTAGVIRVIVLVCTVEAVIVQRRCRYPEVEIAAAAAITIVKVGYIMVAEVGANV